MSGRDSNYVAYASIPFFFMMVLCIALITIFPEIVTVLPDMLISTRK
jgi:TRAP-type C4-dicarboxylate transport system permease large subunit